MWRFPQDLISPPSSPSPEPKPTEGKQPIPRKKSTAKKRSVELIQQGGDGAADDVSTTNNNVAKRPKKSNRSDEGSDNSDGNRKAAPVYQKIKSGRTLGYPITVTQGGTNNKISQHDAILLNCDENPEEYLGKFAYDDKVKIRWMIAGYSDFVAVGTITLKQIDAAPPTRKAAANSGLMLQPSDGGMVTRDEAIPQPVTSSTAIKTEDIDTDTEEPLTHPVASDMAIKTEDIPTDDEATHQVKNGPTPPPVIRNVAIKTEDIDTDTEETYQEKDGPLPELVTSNIKTDDIDTDTEEMQPLEVSSSICIKAEEEVDTDDEIDTQKLNKAGHTDNLTLADEAVVLKLFEKLNSYIEKEWGFRAFDIYPDIEEMTKANEYLINAKCPQAMTEIEAGCTLMEAVCRLETHLADTRDLLFGVVRLGGKATDKCYEYVMDGSDWGPDWVMSLEHLVVLLLSGYFPTKKSNFFLDKFFLDDLAEGFEEDEEEWYNEIEILRVLHKDVSLGDNLSCGEVDSTVMNNINGLPPLRIGETHAEGGPMEKLLIRFPRDTDDEAGNQDKNGSVPEAV